MSVPQDLPPLLCKAALITDLPKSAQAQLALECAVLEHMVTQAQAQQREISAYKKRFGNISSTTEGISQGYSLELGKQQQALNLIVTSFSQELLNLIHQQRPKFIKLLGKTKKLHKLSSEKDCINISKQLFDSMLTRQQLIGRSLYNISTFSKVITRLLQSGHEFVAPLAGFRKSQREIRPRFFGQRRSVGGGGRGGGGGVGLRR